MSRSAQPGLGIPRLEDPTRRVTLLLLRGREDFIRDYRFMSRHGKVQLGAHASRKVQIKPDGRVVVVKGKLCLLAAWHRAAWIGHVRHW